MTSDLRARLEAEGLRPTAWQSGPYERYEEHRHDYDKVLAVETGSIVFHLATLGTSVVLRAGDRLELPTGTSHAADVGPDGVSCLEAHLPRGALSTTPRHVRGWGLSGAAREAGVDRPDRSEREGPEAGGAAR